MDAVMDIASRATAFIGVIQQLSIDYSKLLKGNNLLFYLQSSSAEFKTKVRALREEALKNDKLMERAVELILISNTKVDRENLTRCLLKREIKLLYWMKRPGNLTILSKELAEQPFPTPEAWRNTISRILYKFPSERTGLSHALNYLPMQVVLAVGGKREGTLMQRILQEWDVSDKELETILSKRDIEERKKFGGLNTGIITVLLEKESVLIQTLLNQGVPLPFDLLFTEELKEIKSSRQQRLEEKKLTSDKEPSVFISPNGERWDASPTELAISMNLYGLALSGGGIRSATFSLGILQAFGKANLLNKFDYLSTVSGGGYIGSWLAAWIKREASVQKVADRLNPEKSRDPQAEEVRPVRWLRMYSNYLNPRSGIMSVDAWTTGMTVVRNLVLNQLIILQIIFVLLLCQTSLFNFWRWSFPQIKEDPMLIGSSILIVIASVLAGFGMQLFDKGKDGNEIKSNNSEKEFIIRFSLLALTFTAALIASRWLHCYPIWAGILSLKPLYPGLWWVIFPVIFSGLSLVAILGRYDRCVPKPASQAWSLFLVGLFSALAAFISCCFLALVSYLLFSSKDEIAFIIGPPLVIEALSLTIVFRMALLGNFFPDERREWWGRMGGIIHRIAFLWILIAGSLIIGEVLLNFVKEKKLIENIVLASGGWAVIMYGVVKAAFSPKSAENKPGYLSAVFRLIASIGPYIFGLGLLIFLPVFFHSVLESFDPQIRNSALSLLIMALILAGFTLFLSWRVGVNEFSLHHFYKNRLIRAYLGATIARLERQRSSSYFTGFNSRDDIKLKDLTNAKGYFGPYPIINATLNATDESDLDRQDRKGECFIFSPLFCGFDFSRTRASTNLGQKSYDYGYRPTNFYAYPSGGPSLGTTMAISGAAANPNRGSHSSAATAFLLTVFNVRLGWWIGNPRKSFWRRSDPKMGFPYIVKDLIGRSSTRDKFVCLSDGGHFDNMGLYELVRRRTSVIVLCDGEQDDKFQCEGLANAIRRCRIDFGVEIEIDVSAITDLSDNYSEKSYAIGTISYPDVKNSFGYLIYLKSSVTIAQSQDVKEYNAKNKNFPHQSTGDQFFDENQFESYRKLGFSIADLALKDPKIQEVLQMLRVNYQVRNRSSFVFSEKIFK